MLNFLRKGEHQYHFGFHNVIQGIDVGLSRPEVRAMIEELFPDYKTLNDEFHINLMLIKHEDVAENELALYKYLPLAEICFVPEKEKGIIHVRVKKRDPSLGHVIFKDTDSFYGNDEHLISINAELIEILVEYYEFVTNGYRGTL